MSGPREEESSLTVPGSFPTLLTLCKLKGDEGVHGDRNSATVSPVHIESLPTSAPHEGGNLEPQASACHKW